MLFWELLAGLIFLSIQGLFLKPLLLGQTTLIHDNLLWNYPVFKFFASCVANGVLPLWNPLEHGGEPFYPILAQLRFFEPVTILVVLIGKFFTQSAVILFHWNRLIQLWLLALGMYLFLRPFFSNLWTRIALLPLLLYSSFFLGNFAQDGLLNQFLWAPYIAIFFFKIFFSHEKTLINWVWLVVLTGLSFQNYFFSGISLWLLASVIALLLFYRTDLLQSLKESPRASLRLLLVGFLILMATPMLVLLSESNNFVFPSRMAPADYATLPAVGAPIPWEGKYGDAIHGIKMPYSFIQFTGGSSNFWDFLQVLSPEGNSVLVKKGATKWGHASETYLYLGFLPLLMCFIGLFHSTHRFKRFFLVHLLFFFLLLLGPNGGLHQVLYHLFPPLWFVRNTSTLILFLVMPLLYFFALGFESFCRERIMPKSAWLAFAGLVTVTFVYHPRPLYFCILLFLFFLIPLLLSFTTRHRSYVLFVFISLDLVYHLYFARQLYAVHEPLGVTTQREQTLSLPPFARHRMIPTNFPDEVFTEGNRYFSLVLNQPTAFSLTYPYSFEYVRGTSTVDFAIQNRRWNSFLLRKDYFTYIHSKTPADTFERLFAFNADIFQFQMALDLIPEPINYSIQHYSPNRILLSVTAPRAGFLFWSDGFDPYWKARVNGDAVKLQKPFSNFKGLAIPAGTHEVEFTYFPLPILLSWICFYLPLSFAAVSSLRRLSPRLRRHSSAPNAATA